ncbi:MAG: hypothetical protein ISR43_06085 [Acidimicrobiia bacterium]|nr:hypothetical protein [Actinomycetota bacterium]MBL6924318.1 hypothetical protein [Acidimicrobiia bacterium]MBL6926783.1 hypothetical protein [Acidimicrobiia bacterium]
MPSEAPETIWYVAYGSNLLEARFLAYLTGCGDGEPWGPHRGAADPSPPKADRRVEVPHPVRFGGNSQRWGGGCCFCPVEPLPTDRLTPVGRAWLVTRSQLADIVTQENRLPADSVQIPDRLPKPGDSTRVIDGLIDRLLAMPPIDGISAVTLASTDPPPIAPPAPRYRTVLAGGMAEMGMTPSDVDSHLADLDRS